MAQHAVSHEAVTRAVATAMRTQRSALRNGVSTHAVEGPISIEMLRALARHLPRPLRPFMYVGSIDGGLVVSALLEGRPPASTGAKRARGDGTQRAREVLEGVAARAGGPSEREMRTARAVVAAMIDLTGSGGEAVVESVGVNRSANGPERAANMSALVLAARLSPAIAVPIARLLDALGPCVDGALTTRTEHLDEAFRLPSPSGAAHVDAAGQRPFFVFAGIPEGADAPESARDAPEGAPEPKRRRVAAAT